MGTEHLVAKFIFLHDAYQTLSLNQRFVENSYLLRHGSYSDGDPDQVVNIGLWVSKQFFQEEY